MTQSAKPGGSLPDFVAVRERYEKMSPGDRAQLGKRIGSPEDVALVPAFYKLFPGITPNERNRQVAFFIPWCRQQASAPTIGASLARADVNEKRLFQVVRSQSPNDLIYFRRLLQRLDLSVDWSWFGKSLFFWNDNEFAKRQLIEQFFVTRHSTGKGE